MSEKPSLYQRFVDYYTAHARHHCKGIKPMWSMLYDQFTQTRYVAKRAVPSETTIKTVRSHTQNLPDLNARSRKTPSELYQGRPMH